MKQVSKSLFIIGLLVTASGFADLPKSLPSFKGLIVGSFSSQIPVTLNTGSGAQCNPSTTGSDNLRAWHCTVSGASFEITRGNGSVMQLSVPRFSVIEFVSPKKGSVVRSYYYKGTWNETIHGVTVTDNVIFVVNEMHGDKPSYRGYIQATDLNISEQVVLNPTN